MSRPENPFLRGAGRAGRFWLAGHRGARALAPENTMPGIGLAIELGVDMVEVDVRLSRDGVPVVIHDATVTRTTDAAARFPGRPPEVAAYTAAELAGLDACGWFGSPDDAAWRRRDDPRGVPALAAVLARLSDAGVAANIEIKALPRPAPGLVEAVLDGLRRRGGRDPVLVSSFDHGLIRDLKRAEPGLACGVLSSDRPAEPVSYLRDLVGADAWHPGAGGETDILGLEDPAPGEEDPLVRDLTPILEAGFFVLPWTVNDAGAQLRLRRAGVSGLIVDDPRSTRENFER